MAHENLGFVVSQYGELAKRLSNREGDMYVLYRKLGQDPSPDKGINTIESLLRNAELSGGVVYFTARSRRNRGQEPIGVSVAGVGDELDNSYRIGFYFPSKEDVRFGQGGVQEKLSNVYEAVQGVNNKKKGGEFEFHDPLDLMTNDKFENWRQNGLLNLPEIVDHNSNVTKDDEDWMGKRNEEFLGVFALSLVESVAKVMEAGVRPFQLTSRGIPVVEAVRGVLTINVDEFLNTGHSHLIDDLIQRDDGRCSMPISRLVYEEKLRGSVLSPGEIPVCGRRLKNYIPVVKHSRHRLKLDQIGENEANHIVPRGGAMSALLKALWNGIIPLDLCKDPEMLLAVLSKIDIPKLSTVNGIDLPAHRAEFLRFCAATMPFVDWVVNSLLNLVLADEQHHHDWYHADEKIRVGVSGFLQAINNAQLIPVDSSSPKYPGWIKEQVRLILNNDRFGQTQSLDYGDRYALLRQGRMLVGTVGGRPYWQNINTPDMLSMARHRTRMFINRKIAVREEQLHWEMDALAGDKGVGIDGIGKILELQQKLARVRDEVTEEMRIRRKRDRTNYLLERFGIEFNNWPK